MDLKFSYMLKDVEKVQHKIESLGDRFVEHMDLNQGKITKQLLT